jgi:hypothetical protein
MNYDQVIEVIVRASNPELLTGLDLWLRLGLISDGQVKKIAHQCLCCRLCEPVLREDIFATETEENSQIPVLTKVNFSTAAWQALRDELSVRWLLFLGVFLVVLSSGVLAATQWQNFPPFGQYAVLWSYTIVFWLVGLWLGREENLRITSQTLQNISLLLIPINFWAIDSFRLGSNLIEWVTIGIAFISLTAIVFLQSRQGLSYSPYSIAFLALSYLHWRLSEYSLVAVYLGTIGAVVSLSFLTWRHQDRSTPSRKKTGRSLVIFALVVLLVRAIFILKIPIVDLGLAIALCGWLLTVLAKSDSLSVAENTNNAIDLNEVNNNLDSSSASIREGELKEGEEKIDRVENDRQSRSFPSQVLSRIGLVLIFLGWLIPLAKFSLLSSQNVGKEWFIIQSSLAGVLGLYFYWQELLLNWRRRDLILLFIIGLQELLLFKELIPLQLRQGFSGTAIAISQAQTYPYSIYGVTGYIYLIAWVFLANWLKRKNRDKLATTAENILLIFGLVLTYISLPIPACRSINLLLATFTLGYFITHRLPYRVNLIYCTHLVSLLTLFSCLNWWLPNLSQLSWSYIFLVITIIEWKMSISGINNEDTPVNSHYKQIWCSSSWYFGFIWAGISYLCLWNILNLNVNILTNSNNIIPIANYGVLPWLLIPVTLTAVAHQTPQRRRISAATSSCIALIIAQSLTIWQPETKISGFAVAIGLMLLNTRYLRTIEAALLHFAFGLGFIIALLWEIIEPFDFAFWSIAAAASTLILWLFRAYLTRKDGYLATLYAIAADSWSNLLFNSNLLIFSIYYFVAKFSVGEFIGLPFSAGILTLWQQLLIASIILAVAIVYRYGKNFDRLAIYRLAWIAAIIISQLNTFIPNSTTLTLSIENIIFAFIILFSINRFFRNSPYFPILQTLPLLYATLSIFWRVGSFTSYTGWLTLGAAIIGIGVAKANFFNSKLTYFSLALISLGIYELIIYRMLQVAGGSTADGLTVLAAVTASIALNYLIFAFVWRKKGHNSYFSLSLDTIIICAHTHWAIASSLKIIAATIAIETAPNIPKLSFLSIGVSIILGLYAIVQGRDSQTDSNKSYTDWWVYIGIVEIVATLVYARSLWMQLSIIDPWRILLISIVSLIIYQLPWQSWGWQTTPWHRVSLIMPLLSAIVTPYDISYLSLFTIAAFYGRIAYQQKNLRWSYLSLAFLDWGIYNFFTEQQIQDPLWYAIVFGLSLLYIAQFDRYIIRPSQRKNRHYLRVFGSGIICLYALILHQESGIIPSVISLLFIFAGLALRVRAFLFVGTISFILTGFYQLIILIFSYSFLKWIIGLGTGIILISIAANFERRREQILSLLQGWFLQLRNWQ